MKPLQQLLTDQRVHLMDGAIGTLLYERGVFVNVCYDELNLSHPELIRGILAEYVEAGAELVETNTFGANPVKLSGFGLDDRTEEINRAAAALALDAVDGRAHVLGAIGPLGIRIEPWGPTSQEEARGYFLRQVRGLLAGGVHGFILETFSDLSELHEALRAVQEACDLPVFAQVTIEEGGSTVYGTEVETVARSLSEWGADVIGINCSVGPVEILDAVERMARVTDRPISAQPNAGLPRSVGDRKIYLASPSYMARYARRMAEAGARFVGGCCGTTPEHIREMRASLTGLLGEEGFGSGRPMGSPEAGPGAGLARFVRVIESPDGPPPPAPSPSPEAVRLRAVPLEERSALGRALAEGRFVTSFDLVPAKGWDRDALLERGARLTSLGADTLLVRDLGRSSVRMGGVPAGIHLAMAKSAEVIVQYSCRGRTMPMIMSDLLGAASGGVRNILLVSGALSPAGPYPDPGGGMDIDSIGATNLLRRLNEGRDPGGEPLDPPTRFVIGVMLNQGAADPAREARRFRWKVEAGADFALTQPIFDPSSFHRYLEGFGGVPPVPLIGGVRLLRSLAEAEYLAQEVPGVQVPAVVLQRMESAELRSGVSGARAEGLEILRETLATVLPVLRGIHLVVPEEDAPQVLDLLGEERGRG